MVLGMQARNEGFSEITSPSGELKDSGEFSLMGEAEPYFLAADPGLHTGWAIWDRSGICLDFGTTHDYDELHDKLASFPVTIKTVIIEDYTLWYHKARKQAGSKMPAPKAIGQLETFARLWGAEIVKQPSSIKPIAERLTGKFTKGLPKIQTHVIDAINHGEYYLIQNKVKKMVL